MSVYVAMCILYMDYSFTFLSLRGDGQIKLRRPLRLQLMNSVLLSHFLGCPENIQSGNIYISSL